MSKENTILTDKNALVILSDFPQEADEISHLKQNFCGQIFSDVVQGLQDFEHVFLCGDFSDLTEIDASFKVIKELSVNYASFSNPTVSLGQVPIIVHNAGVYFRQLFPETDLFNSIINEHEFQELTESNKSSKAFRKGIYLTKITKNTHTQDADALNFRLLRCSSNLTGATDNFRKTDEMIVSTVNKHVESVFKQPTDLNHVLAQIYYNQKGDNNKESKAKIKAHADKTKDMPKEGLIAFCTFYNDSEYSQLQPSLTDKFDWCYKNNSGLTRLLFKLKSGVQDDSLVDSFSVTLYPNSVFIIPLSTNRFYTHEIRPSMLNIDKMPTRMGYVIRCSNLEAVYKQGQTYIKENDEWIPLVAMTEQSHQSLKNDYYTENVKTTHVDYGRVGFSMNSGDYKKPIY